MWILGFILLPIVFSAPNQLKINNYAVSIVGTTLSSVSSTADPPSDQLNLAGLGLRSIANNVINDLRNLKNLSLARNELTDLPEFLFANLNNLEYLSLVDNQISTFAPYTFIGLNSLKILNISNNSIRSLKKNWFFGLPKSSDILTLGNKLDTLENELFENPQILSDYKYRHDFEKAKKAEKKITDDTFIEFYDVQSSSPELRLNKNLRVKICIQEGTVKLLDIINNNETLPSDCHEVKIDYKQSELYIPNLGISSFESGWYRIRGLPIHRILLYGNNIVTVSKELLNNLPNEITHVSLPNNKIERLDKGIQNKHLHVLELNGNLISEIEDGALQKTNLKLLGISWNRLNSTNFAATLPSTLKMLFSSYNQIAELPDNSFSELKKLQWLDLDNNKIKEVTNRSFRGLSSLQKLNLHRNGLHKIVSGSFQDLKALRLLNLNSNKLKHIEKGVFSNLDAGNSSQGFLGSLKVLNLDFNDIENLKAGSFINIPKLMTLSLVGNKISKIENGSFDLPDLFKLNLMNNLLEEIDGKSFEGLERLRSLLLGFNRIVNIEKGAMKNLGRLYYLNLRFNPIRKLKNGAFFGLCKSGGSSIELRGVPVELIQGGLFDDV